MDPKPLYIPDQNKIEHTNLYHFISFANRELNLELKTYEDLYKFSVSEIKDFWELIWKYSKIKYSEKYSSVLEYSQPDKVMPGAKWFSGAKLNFAENLLANRSDDTAIISYNENKEADFISYNELYSKTSILHNFFRQSGVIEGDRIAALITNIPESVVGMLAATSLGSIWSSTSPDFGVQGIVDRFEQISPKFLIAVDGYKYNGKSISILETLTKLKDYLPADCKMLIISKIHSRTETTEKLGDTAIIYDDIMQNYSQTEIRFTQLPFDHPVYIMFSSGTTGKPKCIVHGAGGTLLQHSKELRLHTDLKKDDTISYFTTCGWMMWNWLVSSLMTGARIFLYDGSPAFPDIGVLWEAIEKFDITIFGTSPKFLTSCQQSGLIPSDEFDLSGLKTILSTGSPLSSHNFEWVYSKIGANIQLSSISGGTDIISCFMLGNPMLPVYSEEVQCRGLGMAVEAWDENRNSLIESKGELVCTKVFPSMPIFFWNDNSGDQYKNSYFNHFEGAWRHGDFIKITERGGVIVYGRSDATLNPGGVRIGTAEIYRTLELLPELADSLAVGYPENNDVSVVLFVVLKSGFMLDGDLLLKIKEIIKKELTPRHLPKYIFQINEVPVTLNGKKVETAVTKILTNQIVTNQDSLLNPDSLKQFENLNLK